MSTPAVQVPRFIRGLLTHEQSVLRVLLYFDIFDHPLTAEEIFSFLPSRGLSINGLTDLMRSGALKRIVNSRGRFFFLRSAPDSCIDDRLTKEQFGLRRLRIAVIVGRFIGLFPFVRSVMLSGELSKGIASRNSDIDFAIITRTRRLWICRTILILFKKIFLVDNKKYFCLNHFISEEDLSVEIRNIFTATEIATLKPLYNRGYYARFMTANQWIRDFFPNRDLETLGHIEESNSASSLESRGRRHLANHILDQIDLWLMIHWRKLWQRRYAHISDEERRRKFRCEPTISTAYGEDYQEKILTQYSRRLRQCGISGPEQRN